MIIIRFNVRLFYVTSSRKSSHNNYKSSQQLQEFTTITRVHNNYKSSQQLQEFTTITRVHNNYKSSQQLHEFTTITSISNNPEHQMHTHFQGVMAQLNLTLFTSPPTLQSTVYPMLTTIIQ